MRRATTLESRDARGARSVAAARGDQTRVEVGLAAGIVLLFLLLLIIREYYHFAHAALPIAVGAIRASAFIVGNFDQSRRQGRHVISARCRNGDYHQEQTDRPQHSHMESSTQRVALGLTTIKTRPRIQGESVVTINHIT
jgi:hypothetical protein